VLPIHQVEAFLALTPVHLQDIVLELRNLIAAVAPDAAEVIRWGGLSYFHEGEGGIVKAGICQIGLRPDHIQLAFLHGAFLSEPRGFFEGTQKYKRYIRLTSYEDASWDYLKQLIEQAARFDPRAPT
jgi:hypothetical protein